MHCCRGTHWFMCIYVSPVQNKYTLDKISTGGFLLLIQYWIIQHPTVYLESNNGESESYDKDCHSLNRESRSSSLLMRLNCHHLA